MSSPRQEGRETRRRGPENICISSTRRQQESEIEKAGAERQENHNSEFKKEGAGDRMGCCRWVVNEN